MLTAGRCFWNKELICLSACARPTASASGGLALVSIAEI
jgi:hypothetical protein